MNEATRSPRAATPANDDHLDTIVIGGGQAGLAVGYHLTKSGQRFVILDANERVGDAWRKRWDSLLLFTPARINGLPGMRFPAPSGSFVTKDAMADYLEAYATRFALPVRTGVEVTRLSRRDEQLVVEAGDLEFTADNVVVAMSNHQVPRLPSFANELDPRIAQLHSKDYRAPSQLRPGPVLVVGAGNSGADIAIELAASHPTWLAGQESGQIPFRIERFVARHVLIRLVRFVGHHVLTVRTPIGRKLRPKLLPVAAPLVRVKPKDLLAAGIERVPRVAGVRDGLPLLEDGRVLEVANVVWCTGFRPGFSWIDLPIFGDHQEPLHEAGVVPTEPGLYFVGLHFLYALTSDTITGVRRDAARIAADVVARSRRDTSAVAALLPARSS